MLNPKINQISLDEKEYILFAKHIIFNYVKASGQKRLKKAKILVIGAGGLGCPIMTYLIRSGVGYLGIIDKDKIELSNLNRQILYNITQINKEKTVQAKKYLTRINPFCKIILHKYKLNNTNALEIIQYYDIIIDATDNFITRYTIDKYCYKLHKTHIYGAVQEFEGHTSVFNYQSNLRYCNIYPSHKNISINSCTFNGIIGITTGQIGLLQTTETIKIILGIDNIINNKLLIFNLLNTSIKLIKKYIKKVYSNDNNKNRSQVLSWIKKYQNNKIINRIIIDIRDIHEFTKKHHNYSINIPLHKFKNKKTIFFLKKELNNKTCCIYCNKTYRSIMLSHILKKYNINHTIIKTKKSY